MSYPKYFNQNTLIINRDEVKKGTGKERTYLTAYQDNILEAMKELDGTAFKVYMLLLFNKDGFYLDYSPQYVANQTGISRDSARAAIEKMRAKGFLHWKKEGVYNFYEVAHQIKKPSTAAPAEPAPAEPLKRKDLISQAVPGYDHRDILASINRAREKEQQRRKSQLIDLDAFLDDWD